MYLGPPGSSRVKGSHRLAAPAVPLPRRPSRPPARRPSRSPARRPSRGDSKGWSFNDIFGDDDVVADGNRYKKLTLRRMVADSRHYAQQAPDAFRALSQSAHFRLTVAGAEWLDEGRLRAHWARSASYPILAASSSGTRHRHSGSPLAQSCNHKVAWQPRHAVRVIPNAEALSAAARLPE